MSVVHTTPSPNAVTSNEGIEYCGAVATAAWSITDLYQQKLAQATRLRSEAKSKPTSIVRCHFRQRAQSLDIDASDLAHCIARFGNQKMIDMDLEKLRADVGGAICNGSNPWAQGLRLIEEALRDLSPCRPESSL